jgi:hypothetical protein
MASVEKIVHIEARPEDVWSALRDWAVPHERLVPGFVVDSRLDGADRIVTFFNGASVREVLIDLNEETQRLVWSVADGPYSHHNASAQVFADGDGTRFVWIADFLPDEMAGRMDQMMERGIQTVKATAESS